MTYLNDQHYIGIAIATASQAVAQGNHPFGAILVHGDQILLKAENSVNSEQDVTRHAELNLISQASQLFADDLLKECVLYTSTEPCPMCAGAIYWAGISRVVYGCSAARLAQISGGGFAVSIDDIYAGATNPPQVTGPILEDVAAKHHQSYWK